MFKFDYKTMSHVRSFLTYFIDLQDTTLALDFRVTVLEENGGDDGNSSVAELEVRVETLEGTVADHETRISDTESDVTGSRRIFKFFNISHYFELDVYFFIYLF